MLFNMFLISALLLMQQGCKDNIAGSNTQQVCTYDGKSAACGELLFFSYDLYKNNIELKAHIANYDGIIVEDIRELNMIRAKFETDKLSTIKSKFEEKNYIKHVDYNYSVIPE